MPKQTFLFLLFFNILNINQGHAQRHNVHEPWQGQDKALHFILSSNLTLFADSFATTLSPHQERFRWMFGVGIPFLAGSLKEFIDLLGFGTPSWKDLGWNGLGILFGMVLSRCFEWTYHCLRRLLFPDSPWSRREDIAFFRCF